MSEQVVIAYEAVVAAVTRHVAPGQREPLLTELTAAVDPLAPRRAPAPPPEDWLNQVCRALGLFDGARPVSPQHVLWTEVLPTIEALKTNSPEAGVLVAENERVQRLWRDALGRLVDVSRRLDAASGRARELQMALEQIAKIQYTRLDAEEGGLAEHVDIAEVALKAAGAPVPAPPRPEE